VAQAREGRVAGLITFVAHGGKTYQLLGLASEAALATYQSAFAQAEGSFAPLDDPAALAAQPARVQLVTVAQPTTLAELARQRGSSVPIERLAIINQMEPGTPLQAGQKIKLVKGGVPEATVSWRREP
jgi:predicted Zn-dependent protease